MIPLVLIVLIVLVLVVARIDPHSSLHQAFCRQSECRHYQIVADQRQRFRDMVDAEIRRCQTEMEMEDQRRMHR